MRARRQGIPVRHLAAYNGIRNAVPVGSAIYSKTIHQQGRQLLALFSHNTDITHWVAKICNYPTQEHNGRRYIVIEDAGFDAFYLIDRLACLVYNDPTALIYEEERTNATIVR